MEPNERGIRLSVGTISIIVLLIIQITAFAFGYGQLTQQVEANRELIRTYQSNQISIISKLDDLNFRITKLETIISNQDRN